MLLERQVKAEDSIDKYLRDQLSTAEKSFFMTKLPRSGNSFTRIVLVSLSFISAALIILIFR